MNKIWIVWGDNWGDNGETYDDHYEWLVSAHATEEGANAAKAMHDARVGPPTLYRGKTTYSVIDQELLP